MKFEQNNVNVEINVEEIEKYIDNIFKQMELAQLPSNIQNFIKEGIYKLDTTKKENVNKLEQVSIKITTMMTYKLDLAEASRMLDEDMIRKSLMEARNAISDITKLLDVEDPFPDSK